MPQELRVIDPVWQTRHLSALLSGGPNQSWRPPDPSASQELPPVHFFNICPSSYFLILGVVLRPKWPPILPRRDGHFDLAPLASWLRPSWLMSAIMIAL
jgi:hypothetical protein